MILQLTLNYIKQFTKSLYNLGHGHSTVALVVSKLGLLVGGDGQRGVVQLGIRRSDGLAENLLKPLVDVHHGLAAVRAVLLQTLKTHAV